MRTVHFLLDSVMAPWLVPLSQKERVRYTSARECHCWPPHGGPGAGLGHMSFAWQ